MKKTSKNTNMEIALGLCVGLSVGTSIGSSLGNVAVGNSLGIVFGMVIGLLMGSAKDKEVNNQIEEKNYIIREIQKNEQDEEYIITIANKSGEENIVNIPKGQMEAECFSEGDTVYLDDDDMIEQAYDNEDE